jgi:ATP-binding cassette subfamily F protein 3
VLFTFYAQHQLESLNVEHTILEELKYANPTKTETECRTILGCFLFTGEDVFKKIKVLSGGEKSRVALAKVLVSEANFLLLDEPTNHLDMQSVNILIQALRQYEGSFVVVSHDRFFVEAIAEKIWYIEDKEVKSYPGTYQEYEWWQEERGDEGDNGPVDSKSAEVKFVDKKPAAQPVKQNNFVTQQALQKKVAQLEQQIENLEKRKSETEAKLADSSIYSDPAKLNEINRFYADIKQKITQATDEWETAMLEMEELG